MTRHLCRGVWRKRRGARFQIAEMTVEPGQRCARADDSQINGDAMRVTKKLFRRIHQSAAQAGSLAPRLYAQQTQVTAAAAELDVNAAAEASSIFGDQEFSFFHIRTNAAGIDAIALDERQLDAKSNIDQRREGFDVGAPRVSNSHAFQG